MDNIRLEDKLTQAAVQVCAAKNAELIANQAWHDAAIECRFSQVGGDGLECSDMSGFSDDPFCYSDNCPLLGK